MNSHPRTLLMNETNTEWNSNSIMTISHQAVVHGS